jgi:hypothetical protein
MTTSEVMAKLAGLSRAEKAEVVERLVREMGADLVHAWFYAESHRSEIDAAIEESEAA